ncbi:MAG: riboflavin biosynthesis protein RibF [Oscillospiraceae bacterium]|nr:riboflavin biosynthesis protein RibF [Oscillospiraceae bacterium]MDD6501987.1 riboflavin biosynthesis protein RibF [Oscillospiraceae bacterium]MDY4104006.1 riboflavin biosynthesis protein RibF [Oscillospiraceae bacterium]
MRRVVALGFFDGVHLGHGVLLDLTRRRAEELGAVPSAISFDVHPDTLVRGETVPLITNHAGREELMRRLYGIQDVLLIHFNYGTMHMPWEQFLDQMVTEFGAVHFVVGHDFRFGDRGQGDGEHIRQYCEAHGLSCDIVAPVYLNGEIVSSTLIRKLLMDGEMERANAFLGHPYELTDVVRHGFRLGSKMGTPTVNMRIDREMLVPRHGVYATRVYLEDGREFPGVTNIGVRPTVSGGDSLSVETFILDFSGDLYESRIRVTFHHFIRPEQKFPDVEALKQQILHDAETSRQYFLNQK